MTVCETLPLLPDTHVGPDTTALGEPLEVGPFRQGRVFLKVMEASQTDGTRPPLTVDVGISPTGYDDWDGHWHTLDRFEAHGEGMYSCPIENFGNWLRLQLSVEADANYSAQAWFVGEG